MRLWKTAFASRQVEAVGAQGDEIARGIAGKLSRPLHVADLAHGVGRDRNCDVGEAQAAPALAAEHHARGASTGARVVATSMSTRRGAGDARLDRDQIALGPPGAGRKRQEPARGRRPAASQVADFGETTSAYSEDGALKPASALRTARSIQK